MEIDDLKYIKAAYGFENLGTCAFSSKVGRAGKSFREVSNYVFSKPNKKSWIAIFIPKASRNFRKDIQILPDISMFEGYIAGFQELVQKGGLNFKEWGIDERWDWGIPAERIFAFKKPRIKITDIFEGPDLKNFYAAATASAAYRFDEEHEKKIISNFSMDDLIEINKEKKFFDLYSKLKNKF